MNVVVTMLFPASKLFDMISDPWLTMFKRGQFGGTMSKQLLQIAKKSSHKLCRSMASYVVVNCSQ